MVSPMSPLITPADAPVYAMPGIEFTGFAAPSRGAAENAVWTVCIEPGTPGVLHSLTREEVMIALEGRARITITGEDHDLEAGGAVVIPADTEFALANPYDAPFRAVAVLPVGGKARVGDETFVPPWTV